jgi:hypothetical protein
MAEVRDWLHELLSVPEDEHGGFVAALSEGGILPPHEVTELLTKRLATLDMLNAEHEADLALWSERLPRILLVESEYQLAMRKAEASWVRALLAEITEGTISGMDSWRQIHETGEMPAEMKELDELAMRGWDDKDDKDDKDEQQGPDT